MNQAATILRDDHRRHGSVRTCVGCGREDAPSELVRLVVAAIAPREAKDGADPRGAPETEIAFDLAGGRFGRGAHVHPRVECLTRAPHGLSRAFRRSIHIGASELGRLLLAACERRITGLLLAARRIGALALGADASVKSLGEGAPLAVVAVDAGGIASSGAVTRAVAEGRAVAWGRKESLGALLGEPTLAICAVRHDGIAAELKKLRAVADAAAAATGEGAECSRRPEAR